MNYFINTRKAIITGFIFFVMSAPTSLLAEGQQLYMSNGCEGCHGAEGAGSLGPRLAGQQEKYLMQQFKLIRDEKRTSGQADVMSPAVKNVSDDDISQIAAYLSGLK